MKKYLIFVLVALSACTPPTPSAGVRRQALVGDKIDLSFNMPMVDGRNDGVGMGTRQVPDAKVAQMIYDNELDLETTVAFYDSDETNVGDILGGYDVNSNLESPIGIDTFSAFSYIRGTLHTFGVGYQPYGCDVKIRAWEKPDSGKGGMRALVNGCQLNPDVTWTPASGTIPEFNTLWAMSRNGTSTYLPALLEDGPWAWHGDDNAHRPEGVSLGDSLVAMQYNYASYDRLGLCSRLYTMHETRTRDGIYSFAYPGDRLQDQYSKFAASDLEGQESVQWVLVNLGTNNILDSNDGPTLIGHYQDLLDDVCSSNPGVKFVVEAILPAKTYYDGGGGSRFTAWQYANQAIMGTRSTGSENLQCPSGCTLHRYDGASQYMDAGNHGGTAGDLWSSCDSGDHIHPNIACRIKMAELQSADLRDAGALP